MPEFPEFCDCGADMYICQKCHKDLCSKDYPPTWMIIPGTSTKAAFKGNVCPSCTANQYMMEALTKRKMSDSQKRSVQRIIAGKKKDIITEEDIINLERASRLNVITNYEAEFIQDVTERFKRFGINTKISEKQRSVLVKLAKRYRAWVHES